MDKKDRYIFELHNWEVNPTKQNELMVRSVLKENITDKIEQKFKLSKKSLGHQYLILLGLDVINTKGHSTWKKFKC